MFEVNFHIISTSIEKVYEFASTVLAAHITHVALIISMNLLQLRVCLVTLKPIVSMRGPAAPVALAVL